MVNWRFRQSAQFDLGHSGLHMSWACVEANEAFDTLVCLWHMVWCEGQVNLFLRHDLLLLLFSVR